MAAASFALAVKASADGGVPSRKRFSTAPESLTGVDPIVAEARKRWNRCQEAEDEQRTSILQAKKFRAGDQWPEAIKIQRQGSSAIQGVAAQPARPCLTIDRLSQPVRQLSNQIKQAALSIDVLPNGFGADSEIADIWKGYLRQVQNKARAESPVEWAADGAIEGGIGWFRIRTDYVHETWDGAPQDPAAYDQELRLERITNNLAVYCDPSALKPTRSDALFMFVTEDLDRDDYRARYGTTDEASLDAFSSTGDLSGWVDKDTIRIAEYWRVRFKDIKIEAGNLSRTIRQPIVEGFKINAVTVLERWDWLGSRIPLIPILGEELNIDGKPVLRGVIQEGMDAQRMLNYTYSGAIEIFALGNKAPYIAATGAVDNYKEIWQTANTANYSWLPWDPFDDRGRPMPPPERIVNEPPIQAAVALMLRSEEAIKATTGVYDPSLEYNNPREHSGAAIDSLQRQSDVTGSNYPNNVQRALIYAGELMLEIAPKITRPGQLVQIIGADDQPEQLLAGVPFVKGENGVPQPASQDQISQGLHEFYDLTKGRYGVTVVVGKAQATQRQETAFQMGQLLPHMLPEQQAVLMPEYIEQLPMPNAHKMAEKLRKILPPQLQDDQGNQAMPPQAQAALQQLQAQNQQLQQLADKNRTDLMKTQMQEQGDSQRAAQANQVAIEKALISANATQSAAQIKVDAENFRSFVDAEQSKLAQMLDLHMQKVTEVMQRTHEHVQSALDRMHEVNLERVKHQHAMQQGAQQAAVAGQQQASQQMHEQGMAAQQAQSADATGEP